MTFYIHPGPNIITYETYYSQRLYLRWTIVRVDLGEYDYDIEGAITEYIHNELEGKYYLHTNSFSSYGPSMIAFELRHDALMFRLRFG